MKRLIAVTGVVLILSIVITGGIMPSLGEKKAVNEQRSSQAMHESSYIVKEYNGKIAVFQSGNEAPFRTTDMMISLLPEYDKELLKDGIEVKSQRELDCVLEDYLS